MKAILAAFLAFVGLTTTAILLATGQIGPRTPLHIAAAPAHANQGPMLHDWAEANRVDLTLTFLPEAALVGAMTSGPQAMPDAIWPESRLWLGRLDPDDRARHVTVTGRQPVVLALKARIAQELGWSGRDDVTMAEIARAAKEGWFRLGIGSASQGSLGAATYLGLFPALSGAEAPLDAAMLETPETQDAVLDFLAQVDRTTPDGASLTDLLVGHPDHLDAMLTTEAQAIRANRLLAEAGGSALHVVYPADLPARLDSPIAFLPAPEADGAREEVFLALAAHLTNPDTAAGMVALGRRPALPGEDLPAAMWNPDLGLQAGRSLPAETPPEPGLVSRALALYQTELRKPSLTVWLLDHSYSMGGAPLDRMREAMTQLLDGDAASEHLLQPSARDAAIILPFNEIIADPIRVETATPVSLDRALRFLSEQQTTGAESDVYYALYEAYQELARFDESGRLGRYLPAIVLVTDAASAQDSREALLAHRQANPLSPQVPIIAIPLAEADRTELQDLATLTGGTVIDARDGLAPALRTAKAFNN